MSMEGRRGNEIVEIAKQLRAFASKGNPTKELQLQRRQLFVRIIQHLAWREDLHQFIFPAQLQLN